MNISMSWSFSQTIQPAEWNAFCFGVSLLLTHSPSIPVGDCSGRRMEAEGVYDRPLPPGLGDGFDALPVAIELNGVDSECGQPFRLDRRSHGGALSTEGVYGHLAHSIMLIGAATLPGFTFRESFTAQEAGYGMAMAKKALGRALPGLSATTSDEFFRRFNGSEEVAAMEARAGQYRGVRQKVQDLVDSVKDKSPAGEFELVTLRTAEAVLHRLELGVDTNFEADYALHSLEGFFRQSCFLESTADQFMVLDHQMEN
jgi:hypothetical protein